MGIKVNGIQVAGIGAPGKDGNPGAPGKSAYEYAKEGGYAGTEEEFKVLMAGPIPVKHGGTGAITAEEARANLGITDLVTDIGNLHVWEREHPIDEWYEVEPVFTPTIYPDLIVVNSAYSSVSFTYASEIAVDADGNLSLVSPKSITFRSSAGLSSYVATASVLKGMYANFTNCEGCYTKSDFVYFPEDCTFYVPSGYKAISVDKIQHVTGHPAGYTSDYTTSNDPDAYPEIGTVDDATYTHLGQLAALAGGGAKIEVGSYVGTGTYGKSNPCSITASGEIIAIIFLGYVTTANNYFWTEGWNNNDTSVMLPETLATGYTRYRGFASDVDSSFGKKSSDGKTFFWYNTGAAGSQFNEPDHIYYFLVVYK